MPFARALFFFVALASCTPTSTSSTLAPTPSNEKGTAPAPTPPMVTSATSDGGRSLPALETSCARDEDCAVTDDVIAGDEACCPGCQSHAANKSSIARFEAACSASPPPMCPPLGCAMPLVVAKCVASACVGKIGP